MTYPYYIDSILANCPRIFYLRIPRFYQWFVVACVERDGQTAYSVESLGLSSGARHSRPSKILGCDWAMSKRSQKCDPNSADMCFIGEQQRIGFCDSGEWIPVTLKRRRSAKALVSSTLQYSDTRALPRRNGIRPKSETTGERASISGSKDAVIPRRKHLIRNKTCGKQLLSESAMMNENMTHGKSRRCEVLVQSELGWKDHSVIIFSEWILSNQFFPSH